MYHVIVAFVLIAGCDAYQASEAATCPTGSGDPCPRGETSCDVPEASGLVNHCECTTTGTQHWWACSDCPFGEGSDPISCTMPGEGCAIENWEHDCSCECTSAGWWNCIPGTIGSRCPTAPLPDAGVDAM